MMSGRSRERHKAALGPQEGRESAPASAATRLRQLLVGRVAQFLVGPLIGMIAGFVLLFGGIFLDMAWLVGPQPLIDSRHYATFTGKVTGRVVESWTALEFDPADVGQRRRWQAFGKIAACAVVEYEGDWGALTRRAFCGNRFTFSDDFHLDDWKTLAPGVPFAFQRDASGFMLQEIRMSKTALDWLAANPPYSSFRLRKPPPTTALGELKEQFDRPAEVAVASWVAPIPAFPLAVDPRHPAEAMPAKYVDDRQHGFWLGGLVFTVIFAVPGLLVWRMGMGIFFGSQPRATLWVLTLLPLVALPWWGNVLPQLLRHASKDWASIGTDMLDDLTRTTRLIATTPPEATLADGERVVWRLDKGAYADTFGRIHFASPDPPPTTPDAALAALRAQASAEVRKLDASEQAALFVRLEEQKAAGLTETQTVFTSAAEDALRYADADPAVRRAARHFLSFAMSYNEWDLDALGR
jgi:hypothetical protein